MVSEPNKNEIRPGSRQEEDGLEDFFERAESLPNERLEVSERKPIQQSEKTPESEDFNFEINERQDANALREQLGKAAVTQDEDKPDAVAPAPLPAMASKPAHHQIDLPSDPVEVQKALTSRQVLTKAEKLPSLYKARVSYVLTGIVRDKPAESNDGISQKAA